MSRAAAEEEGVVSEKALNAVLLFLLRCGCIVFLSTVLKSSQELHI